jgi:hypothetical protein
MNFHKNIIDISKYSSNCSRIHCNNLFMEKVKYEELFESNIGNDNKFETINKTLHNLNSLFKVSGCDEQICEIIEGKLPTSVKGNALVSLLKILKTELLIRDTI